MEFLNISSVFFISALIILFPSAQLADEEIPVTETSPEESTGKIQNSTNSKNLTLETVLPNGEIRTMPFNPAFRKWKHEEAVGQHSVKSRIVGGRKARKNEAPYQISIIAKGFGQWCGGTIYNENYIITAAHCFFEGNDKMNATPFDFIAGEYDQARKEKSEQHRTAVEIITHPDYTPALGFDDIALIKLDSPLVYGEFVQPLPIANSTEEYPTGQGIISGWGHTLVIEAGDKIDKSGSSSKLKITTIKIFTREECINFYNEFTFLLQFVYNENMMCAGEEKGGKDACQGDSGGPLVCTNQETKAKYLCGIVCTGLGCGQPNRPGFFIIVGKYVDWIVEHAGKGDNTTLHF